MNKSNKDSAIRFLKLASSGKVDEAYAEFIDPSFKHHNAYFKGDLESLKKAMKENALKMPNKTFEVKMSIEEGDRVMTYSHVKTSTMAIAVVHILRFKNGRIVEMWDLGQPISKDSPNENGIF